jgi:hypothetical protein
MYTGLSDKRFNTILLNMTKRGHKLKDLPHSKLGMLQYYAEHNLNNENFIEQSRLYPDTCLNILGNSRLYKEFEVTSNLKLFKHLKAIDGRQHIHDNVAKITYLLQNYHFPNLISITIADEIFKNKAYVDIYRDILLYILNTCELIHFTSEEELASFVPLLAYNHVGLRECCGIDPYDRCLMYLYDTNLLQSTHIRICNYYHSIKLLSNKFAPTWMLLNQLLLTDVSTTIQLYIIKLTYDDFPATP